MDNQEFFQKNSNAGNNPESEQDNKPNISIKVNISDNTLENRVYWIVGSICTFLQLLLYLNG